MNSLWCIRMSWIEWSLSTHDYCISLLYNHYCIYYFNRWFKHIHIYNYIIIYLCDNRTFTIQLCLQTPCCSSRCPAPLQILRIAGGKSPHNDLERSQVMKGFHGFSPYFHRVLPGFERVAAYRNIEHGIGLLMTRNTWTCWISLPFKSVDGVMNLLNMYKCGGSHYNGWICWLTLDATAGNRIGTELLVWSTAHMTVLLKTKRKGKKSLSTVKMPLARNTKCLWCAVIESRCNWCKTAVQFGRATNFFSLLVSILPIQHSKQWV